MLAKVKNRANPSLVEISSPDTPNTRATYDRSDGASINSPVDGFDSSSGCARMVNFMLSPTTTFAQ